MKGRATQGRNNRMGDQGPRHQSMHCATSARCCLVEALRYRIFAPRSCVSTSTAISAPSPPLFPGIDPFTLHGPFTSQVDKALQSSDWPAEDPRGTRGGHTECQVCMAYPPSGKCNAMELGRMNAGLLGNQSSIVTRLRCHAFATVAMNVPLRFAATKPSCSQADA